MSGSDEEDSGNSGQKKDFMYKIKALKRRTIHTVAKNLGKAEQTKDPEFDELYERFEQIDAKMTALRNAAQKFNKAHQAMSEAGSELAHAYLDLYDKDPMLKKLAVEMEAVNEYMISDVSPQLGERWKAQVDEPIKTITDRMQEMKDDAERRKRYMADYDHYRSKKMNLEKAEGREKNLEKVRENEKKLAEASTKYFAMNERLTARLKIADNNKAAMLNEPLLAAIAVQNEIFQQGSAGFQKLYASSKEPKYLQAAQSEAEELARLDSQVKQVVSSTAKPFAQPASFVPPASYQHSSPSGSASNNGAFGGGNYGGSYGSGSQSRPMGAAYDGATASSPGPATVQATAPPAVAVSGGDKYVRALFAYEGAAEIELDLKEGDVVKVLKEDDSGWWQGECNGRVGWFPFNYIEVI